jgi:hypothetical protein
MVGSVAEPKMILLNGSNFFRNRYSKSTLHHQKKLYSGANELA